MKFALTLWILLGVSAALSLVLSLGCGGGGGGGGGTGPAPVSVKVTSTAVNNVLAYGTSCSITGTVSNSADTTVVFSVSPSFSGFKQTGSTTATFTAGTASGTYTITAEADVNHAIIGTLKITVVPLIITIAPTQVTLAPSGVVQFTGTVQGSTNTAVNFTATAGTFTAVSGNTAATNYKAPATVGTYTVTATAAANAAATAKATVTVSNTGGNNATVNGTIEDDKSEPLSGIVVQFFNASGSEVAQATTNSSGVFSGSVPPSAVSFSLSAASINTNNDYEAYKFNTLYYDPLVTDCNAPLPTLVSGGSVTLSAIQVPSNDGPPPPPPNGCS